MTYCSEGVVWPPPSHHQNESYPLSLEESEALEESESQAHPGSYYPHNPLLPHHVLPFCALHAHPPGQTGLCESQHGACHWMPLAMQGQNSTVGLPRWPPGGGGEWRGGGGGVNSQGPCHTVTRRRVSTAPSKGLAWPELSEQVDTHTHTHTHGGRDKQGTEDVLDLVRCKAEQKQ